MSMLTCSSCFMLEEAMVAVLVVPVSCISQGGLEHTLLLPPMVAVATVAVLVVPVSCVSQGGLEQTSVTVQSTYDDITGHQNRGLDV